MAVKMSEHELQNMRRDLQHLDVEISRKSPVSDALSGALMGVAIGFLAHRKDKGHRELLAHAGWGAALGFGFGYLSKSFGTAVSSFGHRLEKEVSVMTPPTPVVTQGYFAGAPRPLYHAGEDVRGTMTGHYVGGAVPPGGDYSFTRRPGYQGKDY
jgi:hypothetical protein